MNTQVKAHNGEVELRNWDRPQAYKVSIKIENEIYEETETGSLDYTVHVHCTGFQHGFPLFSVRKTDFIINKKAPESIVDEITIWAAEAINNLDLLLDVGGKILEIRNFKEIRLKWIGIREKIMKRYGCERVEKYLDSMEESLETPDSLAKVFSKDHFMVLYFNGIYRDYDLKPKNPDFIVFNGLIPSLSIHFDTKKELSYREVLPVKVTEKGSINQEKIDEEELLSVAEKQLGFTGKEKISLKGKMNMETILDLEYGKITRQVARIEVSLHDTLNTIHTFNITQY